MQAELFAGTSGVSYLAPGEYVNTIIKGVTEISPIRSLADVKPTSSSFSEIPKRTGQFAAAWTTEIGSRTETTGLTYGMEQIPNHEMPGLYNRASVFVQPSIVDKEGNTEGLGVVLMEAMACAVPCVASDVGGIPDIVKDGYNGFLVPARDSAALAGGILTLLSDQALNRTMGENARRFIEENYAWTHLTRKTAVLLKSLNEGF